MIPLNNFSYVYMRAWTFPEDFLRLAFVVPPHPSDQGNLLNFCLSLPMVYLNSAL